MKKNLVVCDICSAECVDHRDRFKEGWNQVSFYVNESKYPDSYGDPKDICPKCSKKIGIKERIEKNIGKSENTKIIELANILQEILSLAQY